MAKRVLIIGGGASGMTAAIFAARQGASVTILEHMDRVGKKILSTGNGKCNLTNRRMEPECFRSGSPEFAMKVLSRFGEPETEEFFRDLGVVIKDRNGYLYPASSQASSVLDALREELDKRRVAVVTECGPVSVRSFPFQGAGGKDGGSGDRGLWQASCGKGEFFADSLILAAGSKAAPGTGSDGSGYALAGKLGHTVIAPLPALVQLRCREPFFKQISGVRIDAEVTLLAWERTGEGKEAARAARKTERAGETAAKKPAREGSGERGKTGRKGGGREAGGGLCENGRPLDRAAPQAADRLAFDFGEVQLTDYGISGIPVFQVSRFASRALYEGKRVAAVLDFYPELGKRELGRFLRERRLLLSGRRAESFFTGWFNKKLALLFLKLSGILPERPVEGLSEQELSALCGLIKEFWVEVTATNPYENAQICCGGVDVREVDPSTMESRKKQGLYLAGEILDVDGICGGYNLQWAWSSGAVAGLHAGL